MSHALPLSQSMASERFAIKVKRLSHPTMGCRSNCLDGIKQGGVTAGHLPFGSHLKLASDSAAFVGETVRFIVTITHNFRHTVRAIQAQVEFVAAEGKRTVLADTNKANTITLAPGQRKDYVVEHHLSQPGRCSLLCSLVYLEETANGNIKRAGKKIHPIEVLEPFEIKSSIHRHEAITVVNLQLASLVNRAIHLECVSVKADEVSFEDLSSIEGKEEEKKLFALSPPHTVFGEVTPMVLGESRSYLYRVHMSKSREELWNHKALLNIELTIAWRSLMGERGLITTKIDASNVATKKKEYDLLVVDAPTTARLEQPFSVTLMVRSRSALTFELRLEVRKERSVTVFPCGKSNRSLGIFEPFQTKEVALDLLPVGLGVQAISGFRLSCPRMDTHLDFDRLHEVEVVN